MKPEAQREISSTLQRCGKGKIWSFEYDSGNLGLKNIKFFTIDLRDGASAHGSVVDRVAYLWNAKVYSR